MPPCQLLRRCSQSNLGLRRPGLLAWLFCINTAGSVSGTVVSNGTMIPQLRLSLSMGFAETLNLLAGMVLCALCKVAKGKTAAVQPSNISRGRLLNRKNRIPGTAGFWQWNWAFAHWVVKCICSSQLHAARSPDVDIM